jgi:hypothetical protein
MPKLLIAGFASASLACLCNAAFAETASVGAISAKDLRSDCEVLGGTFGEFTDSKTGAHYYWCKSRGGTTKCVNNNCTVTTRIPINGAAAAAGNARNPGAIGAIGTIGGTTPTTTNPKIGAMTGGAISKGSNAPAAGLSPAATTAGAGKPVMVPGPVSNNNKRQQR